MRYIRFRCEAEAFLIVRSSSSALFLGERTNRNWPLACACDASSLLSNEQAFIFVCCISTQFLRNYSINLGKTAVAIHAGGRPRDGCLPKDEDGHLRELGHRKRPPARAGGASIQPALQPAAQPQAREEAPLDRPAVAPETRRACRWMGTLEPLLWQQACVRVREGVTAARRTTP